MLSINELYEKLNELNSEENKKVVLEYCEEFLSILRKKEYTDEEKDLIEKFVSEGIYQKLLDGYITDSEIRSKMISIRFRYKDDLPQKDSNLGKLYTDHKMFLKIRNSILKELRKEMTPKNAIEQLELYDDYVYRIVDPLSSDDVIEKNSETQKFILPDLFQKTTFHKYITSEIQKELRKGDNIDKKKKARIDAYIYDYIDYLIENGVSIDFENDDLLKVLDSNEINILKNNIRKKENISRRIESKDFSDGNEEENILEFCSDFYELLSKNFYTEKDKFLIDRFVTEDLYLKIFSEHINNPEIRAKIFDIRFKYRDELFKKDGKLGRLYAEQKMFSKITTVMLKELRQKMTEENVNDQLSLLNDYVIKVVDPLSSNDVIEKSKEIKSFITLDAYQKTEFHKYMIEEIKKGLDKKKSIDASKKARIDEYVSDYINYFINNDRSIDFENDNLLKIYSPEEQEKLREDIRLKKILLKEDSENIEKDDLLKILDLMSTVAKKSSFSDTEKQILLNYIDKGFFEKTIETGFIDTDTRTKLLGLRNIYRSDMFDKHKDAALLYNEKMIEDRLAEGFVNCHNELSKDYEPSNIEIDAVNRIANNIINRSFLSHKFQPHEKRFMDLYFEKYFEKSIQNIENVFYAETTLKSLIKTQKYNVFNSKSILGKHVDKINSISNLLRDKMFSENSKNINTNTYERLLGLVAYQNVGNVEILKSGLDELQNRGKKDIYNSSPVNEYIESFIKFYSPEGYIRVSMPNKEKVFDFIYEYVDAITQKEDFNLYNAQGISDILQLIAAERIPKECSEKISQIISENLKINEMDKDTAYKKAMSFCEKRIQLRPDGSKEVEPVTDEKEFDEFLKDVQQLKLTNKLMVSDTIANFIIRQNFEKNSVVRKNPQKYQGVIERTLEDIAFNDVATRMSQTNKRKRCFFIRDVVTAPTSDNNNASNSNLGYMRLSRSLAKRFIEKQDLKVFETIFHENTHTEQTYNSTKRNSYIRYLIEKEGIIRDENPEFYQANYTYMYCEIEARTEGARKLGRFVKNIGLDLEKEYSLEELLRTDILGACKQRIKAERENFELATEKHEKIGDTEKVKVTEYFDQMMQKKPKEILKKHPRLRMEYNEDGTLKTPLEFLTSAPPKLGINLLALYRNVLSRGNIFKSQNLERDLNDLMQVAKEGNAYRGLIIFAILGNVGRMIDEVDSQLEDMPLERLVSLSEVFKKTNEFIENKEAKTFNIAMQKKPLGREDSAQTKMNETKRKIEERLKEFSKEEIAEIYEKLYGNEHKTKEESGEKKLETVDINLGTSQQNRKIEDTER